MLRRLRKLLLKLLRAEHKELEDWLSAHDSCLAKEAFDEEFKGFPLQEDERMYLERAYNKAQSRGCRLSGYELRFILYYHLGHMRRKW